MFERQKPRPGRGRRGGERDGKYKQPLGTGWESVLGASCERFLHSSVERQWSPARDRDSATNARIPDKPRVRNKKPPELAGGKDQS